MVVLALGLQGCAGQGFALITGLRLQPSAVKIARNRQVAAFITGIGVFTFDGNGAFCQTLDIDFGDGNLFTVDDVFLGRVPNRPPPLNEAYWAVPHTYTGWPGQKLIRVKGRNGCLGELTTQIDVTIGESDFYRTAFANQFGPNSNACSAVPGVPALRKGTGVRIVTVPVAAGPLNYCDNGKGCPYDPAGEPGSSAPGNFPFPGLRKYSLIYRVGTQLIQSEALRTLFFADETAPLEICVNDDFREDNSGGLLMDITVNEMTAH